MTRARVSKHWGAGFQLLPECPRFSETKRVRFIIVCYHAFVVFYCD